MNDIVNAVLLVYAGLFPIVNPVGGAPIWDFVARYLRNQKTISPRTLSLPTIEGVTGNPGMA